MAFQTDLDITAKVISGLVSADALAAFFTTLGYETGKRKTLTAEAIGLSGDTAAPVKRVELLAEDTEGFFRVVLVQLRSLTAKSRGDLSRVLGRSNVDHLLVLVSDFDVLEFVVLHKRQRESRGPVGPGVQVIPLSVSVNRKDPQRSELRPIRRLTWTARDGLEQFDKVRSSFEAAAFTEQYFQNRALFSDYYLLERLKEDPAWKDNPTQAFAKVKDVLADAKIHWSGKGEQVVRDELYEPLFKLLGFKAAVNKPAAEDHTKPDYLLKDASGKVVSAAFVYQWDRWLDGPDGNDLGTPDENPGACVVSALEGNVADWLIVTNGRFWRLYSRHAHSRATNFYEVDLAEALTASGDTDPNEAFRFWWLFFRLQAFLPPAEGTGSWLESLVRGSREYAKRLGDRLKDRTFLSVFPHLAQGFLKDRKTRLGQKHAPTDDELNAAFEATLTLLYRLLFLLYAESRELLPTREAPYRAAGLKKIKEEIAEKGGVAESAVTENLKRAYGDVETGLYDRLARLFQAMDAGDPSLNVPAYNGGLFITRPEATGRREHRIARFLAEHKVPDRFLALAIDRLSRDEDEKISSLVFIDYKSLEVRHLGSIYEGLLEFKLKLAAEDLTTQKEKDKERYIPLAQTKPGKRVRKGAAVVHKGEVYLSNDKAERKASGSYYTPDPIVAYIVERTVGPVLQERLETLRNDFRKVRKSYDRLLQNTKAHPLPKLKGQPQDQRAYAIESACCEHRDLAERLFDFKVLDPAMGSGHFLVEAVDFITDRLLNFLNQFPINPVHFAIGQTRRSILESLGQQGVQVDPDKLTDVNLLKRHVLKRCIYGVDLNPMAVELAKVSLWLDAFTLGAPLSFLDHHLRCGNSLIGATFEDLKKATSGELFAIDYGPLIRAINHVLVVAALSDATAAEVKQSADDYDRARKDLSGYQVFLDLLVARYFGFPLAPKILTQAHEIDASSREKFLSSLKDLIERSMVENVENLAHQPDRRFFHWELEFPEVFFGLTGMDQRIVRHRNEIAHGSAGFDAIVGNPPYVRQEALKEFKEYLKANYKTFNAANDLYVFFQEREVYNLCSGGRMGMIVANKWMRAGYGASVRGFLRRAAAPLEVVDFGHAPIFPDADTFPCILIVGRRAEPVTVGQPVPAGEQMAALQFPREDWDERMDLESYAAPRRHAVPTVLLRDEGWSIEDPRVQALLEKIRNTGIPLKNFCGAEPKSGIKTGFNNAFAIDEVTRKRMVKEDKRSAQIIKQLLRGRDIDRWRPRTSGIFLLTIPSSENREWPWSKSNEKAEGLFKKEFPAVHAHLKQFEAPLRKRQDQGRYWWELRSCDYYEALDKPKIVVQCIGFHSRWSLEEAGRYINNKTYLVPSSDPALLAFLNSPLLWWFMCRVFPHMKDEALSIDGQYVKDLPSPQVDHQLRVKILSAVESILLVTRQKAEWLENLDIQSFLHGNLQSQRVDSWLALPTEEFVARVTKAVDLKRPPNAMKSNLEKFQREARARQVELLSEQLDLEKKLAVLVEDAYGLTPEERALLRDTRPLRDPLDVLEAKIRGKSEEIDAQANEDSPD